MALIGAVVWIAARAVGASWQLALVIAVMVFLSLEPTSYARRGLKGLSNRRSR
jgi:hypothetical protein